MYIHRELENVIKPFLRRREILAIVGARQVGKTTFLQYLASEFKKKGQRVAFLTFERERDLALFGDPEDFREYYKDYHVIIIDEFHYARDGGKKLKYLFDTTSIKFIISGSSSLELTFETGRYLVGRMLKFYLYPFSFREYLSFKNEQLFNLLHSRIKDIFSEDLYSIKFPGEEIHNRLRKEFEEYLIFGGYPAVALARTREEKIKILESILENYLLRDIGALLNLTTRGALMRLSEFLSTQIGSLLNYHELSRISGLTYRELLSHLRILEETFIVSQVRPFYKNPRTELVKTPKIYFVDNGFRNYLLSDFRDIRKRDDMGLLVENSVFSLLKRRFLGKINYWRTKSKAEVDFILQREGEILPVEVKYSLSPSIGKSFYSFIEKFSPERGFILTEGYQAIKKIKNTTLFFVPVYYL